MALYFQSYVDSLQSGMKPDAKSAVNFVAAGLVAFIVSLCSVATAQNSINVATVSTKPTMVSGGNVLVRIDVLNQLQPDEISVELGGHDVTRTFRRLDGSTSLLGLVGSLHNGSNTLVVKAGDQAPVRLSLINHPLAGPVFSGPHEEPFICQTEEFTLETGETLGKPIDDNCSIKTRVDYLYKSSNSLLENSLKALPDLKTLPKDVAQLTIGNKTVPYVVRVETGTVNRAIYQTAVLHDPTTQAKLDPWTPNPAWNGKLIYTFGGGCRSGWYIQGASTGGVLDDAMLSRGFATASASLNVFGNNCDDLLAAETMMMVKERFIESYGLPNFTIGWGCSGGSYQSHQIGDNYPGLLDGIVVGCSFPEVGFATVNLLSDSRLLYNYFQNNQNTAWTKEQQRLVAGFGKLDSIANMNEGAARIDPVIREDRLSAEFAEVVPEVLRYDPVTNPEGARATVYDHAVNVYGKNPETGAARRPYDNEGVQYGLQALSAGNISIDQFLDLNEKIGGFDDDADFVGQRSVADPEAVRAAYRTGRILDGGGGLATMPIIDYRAYTDLLEGGDIHMRFHSFSTRERLAKANGDANNQVMLVEDFRWGYFSTQSPVLSRALEQMDQWLTNLESTDAAKVTLAAVVQAKPKSLVDACWTPTRAPKKIAETQTYDGLGQCNDYYPSFPSPRIVAGSSVAGDVIKCQLKPIETAGYQAKFSSTQASRLQQIFPGGVCDWTQPSLYQEALQTWWSYKD